MVDGCCFRLRVDKLVWGSSTGTIATVAFDLNCRYYADFKIKDLEICSQRCKNQLIVL